MKTFTASDLNERIDLYRAVETDDGYGGSTVVEMLITDRWANVYAPKARDGVIAMSGAVTISYEVTVRSGFPVEYGDIIVWHSERMKVVDYRPIQGRQFLSIMCETER